MLFFDDGKKLEKAFNPDQFDALVGILEQREDKTATKEDLKVLEARLLAENEKNRESFQASLRESELRTQVEIEKVRGELKTDIEKVRAELKTDIERVRTELTIEIEKSKTELTEKLESNKHEILKWITGMVVAQAAVFVALAGVAVGLIAFYPK